MMKYLAVILAMFFIQPKFPFLNRSEIKTNEGVDFRINSIDFKKSPKAYLKTSRFRFDKLTKLESVERAFSYQEAISGTDMDLYINIFIPASAKKNVGTWMLMFAANTHNLVRMVYSKAPGS